MALTELQEEAYLDTGNVYGKLRQITKDGEFRFYLKRTGMPCMYQANNHVDRLNADPTHNHRGSLGQVKVLTVFTMDSLFFEASEEILGEDMFELTTPGHPQAGQFFTIKGQPRARPTAGERDSNYGKVYLNPSTRPRIISTIVMSAARGTYGYTGISATLRKGP